MMGGGGLGEELELDRSEELSLSSVSDELELEVSSDSSAAPLGMFKSVFDEVSRSEPARSLFCGSGGLKICEFRSSSR